MYDLILVRRRRRRRIAALVSLFCSIGVSALVIVSFLGQYTGTFTVSLTNSSVRLSLCDKEAFDNPTSYLRIDKLDLFEEYTYVNILHEDLDDESKAYDFGAHTIEVKNKQTGEITQKNVLSYFKYTFYVGNIGSKAAQYNLKINILECTQALDGRTLDDTLRIMVYENDLDDTYSLDPVHNVDVYAKESVRTHTDLEGNKTRREFVSTPTASSVEDENHPLATSFEDVKTVVTYKRGGFYAGQIRRYTLVSWLEGEDLDSTNQSEAPEGATLKLGVEITAYENE